MAQEALKKINAVSNLVLCFENVKYLDGLNNSKKKAIIVDAIHSVVQSLDQMNQLTNEWNGPKDVFEEFVAEANALKDNLANGNKIDSSTIKLKEAAVQFSDKVPENIPKYYLDALSWLKSTTQTLETICKNDAK